MERKNCPYKINALCTNNNPSFNIMGEYIGQFLKNISTIDAVFKEVLLVNSPNHENIVIDAFDIVSNPNIIASFLYNQHKGWLKKMYPNEFFSIDSSSKYGISQMVRTQGVVEESVIITFNFGPQDIFINTSVPRGIVRPFNWYADILMGFIDSFLPDYASIIPIVISKLSPPINSPGWVTYFAPHIALPPDAFEGCTALPLPNGQVMHAIENNHMVAKDEVQFQKLKALVEKFRAYDLKL